MLSGEVALSSPPYNAIAEPVETETWIESRYEAVHGEGLGDHPEHLGAD